MDHETLDVTALLKERREALGLSPAEAARRIGTNMASLFDLEGIPDELETCVSLLQLAKLSTLLKIAPWRLVSEMPPTQSSDLDTVGTKIRQMSVESTLDVLGDKCGWALDDMFATRLARADAYNVDAVRDIATYVGEDWIAVFDGEIKLIFHEIVE